MNTMKTVIAQKDFSVTYEGKPHITIKKGDEIPPDILTEYAEGLRRREVIAADEFEHAAADKRAAKNEDKKPTANKGDRNHG